MSLRHLFIISCLLTGLNAMSAADKLDEERIESTVKNLASEKYEVRASAYEELRSTGEAARAALEKSKESTDPEAKQRIWQLLSLLNAKPELGDWIEDGAIEMKLRPPKGWQLVKQNDMKNAFIAGPKEPGFGPLMIVGEEWYALSLKEYIKEHKEKINAAGKSIEWISHRSTKLQSYDAVRLEYDCTLEVQPEQRVAVRTLQYVFAEDRNFFRITLHVKLDTFENHLPAFEASAKTFEQTNQRVRLTVPQEPTTAPTIEAPAELRE